ncbi:MAG: hypothetical protein ACREMQ_12795 [Longimicrobiales bacterium]
MISAVRLDGLLWRFAERREVRERDRPVRKRGELLVNPGVRSNARQARRASCAISTT